MNFKFYITTLIFIVLIVGARELSYQTVIKEALNKETTAINNNYDKIKNGKGILQNTARSIIQKDTLSRKERRKLNKSNKN